MKNVHWNHSPNICGPRPLRVLKPPWNTTRRPVTSQRFRIPSHRSHRGDRVTVGSSHGHSTKPVVQKRHVLGPSFRDSNDGCSPGRISKYQEISRRIPFWSQWSKNHGLKVSSLLKGTLLWQIETMADLLQAPIIRMIHVFNPIDKIFNPCDIRGASWIHLFGFLRSFQL
jgi:hypothetical protein